ncbi:hypothetical protein DL96DRAFT_858892 [Flagelloscypha sp. PMI_526]|nr:hypothetical protein DL96DRAFT_858892 [Flagelloscypha sp. PMI_526]
MQFTFTSASLFAAFCMVLAAPIARQAQHAGKIVTVFNELNSDETACGIAVGAGDVAVSVSASVFNGFPGADAANPAANPLCGQDIFVTQGQTTGNVQVVDICAECVGDDIAVSESFFEVLDGPAVLEDADFVQVTWEFSQ